MVKGETVAAMQRTSDGDFRSNHSLGGSSARVEISDELRNIGMDIFKQTGIDFVGVELLKGSDGLYFCEINTVPGFESLDMTNDINLAKIMMEVIKLDFSEGNI